MRKVLSVRSSKSIDIWLEIGEFQSDVTTLIQVQSVCFVEIAFAWLNPASTMYKVGNAHANGLTAAETLGYF